MPLTSTIGHLYPSEALVRVGGKSHKAMADQLTTVSKARLADGFGRFSKADRLGVEQAVRVQLGLEV